MLAQVLEIILKWTKAQLCKFSICSIRVLFDYMIRKEQHWLDILRLSKPCGTMLDRPFSLLYNVSFW